MVCIDNRLIEVDRVRSAEEAAGLEALGADLIGVALTADPRFSDAAVVKWAARILSYTTALVTSLTNLTRLLNG